MARFLLRNSAEFPRNGIIAKPLCVIKAIKTELKTEITNQPYSGEFKERIYDIESPWNSQSWTWIKFTDEYLTETIGQFRGFPKDVKYSKSRNEIIVLTSDYIYRLNASDLSIIETKSQPEYQDVAVSPDGIFFFHNYYEIEKMNSSLSDLTEIPSPFKMDDIRFKTWNGKILEFECEEFNNWSRNEIMELDTTAWKIKIKNATQHGV
ncbi:hypothetical protein GZ212_15780 [Mangrovimonas sp. CR14]|uniref:hypothetical protein n=1 Tax=Mangrovimonas sp. CR14 TaxID=2706120 RepID=UPI0014237D39|nr:hypothetical protein [Mangrovimonas sp. CR14]NIK93621.1 hypothetical protein [Mangrovimonas sp. CR14]